MSHDDQKAEIEPPCDMVEISLVGVDILKNGRFESSFDALCL